MTPMQARTHLIQTRAAYAAGSATIDQLYEAADAYITALKQYRKASGKNVTIPSRAYVIRAL
jgi:hypothetical protein